MRSARDFREAPHHFFVLERPPGSGIAPGLLAILVDMQHDVHFLAHFPARAKRNRIYKGQTLVTEKKQLGSLIHLHAFGLRQKVRVCGQTNVEPLGPGPTHLPTQKTVATRVKIVDRSSFRVKPTN